MNIHGQIKGAPMIYVLDANVIINYLKKDAKVTANFDNAVLAGHRLLIPRAVDYEIGRGLMLSNASRKSLIYETMISPFPTGQCEVVDMNEGIWEYAKQIYANLYQKSFTVGEIDILIAAFCLQNSYPLVTANTNDFINIAGLQLVNWWG